MSRNREIENTLYFLAEEANAERIEALFTVDVRRHNDGAAFTTVHLMCDLANAEQFAALTMHLEGIAEVMREIYSQIERTNDERTNQRT